MRVNFSLSLVGSLQFGISGPLDCHVYALKGPDGIVLIDAGSGTHTSGILNNLSRDLPDGRITSLLVTHCHLDHCGGAAEIRAATGCSVLAPKVSRAILENGDEERSGLARAREQGVYPPDFKLKPCPVDRGVLDGESFTAAGLEFTAIHVRGHSPDAFCYLTRIDGAVWLFTGDVVFYGGILGVINADGSGMDGYRADLSKLKDRGVDGLFPGHGLFTLRGGQRHLDSALEQISKGFLGRQIGQGDLLF